MSSQNLKYAAKPATGPAHSVASGVLRAVGGGARTTVSSVLLLYPAQSPRWARGLSQLWDHKGGVGRGPVLRLFVLQQPQGARRFANEQLAGPRL